MLWHVCATRDSSPSPQPSRNPTTQDGTAAVTGSKVSGKELFLVPLTPTPALYVFFSNLQYIPDLATFRSTNSSNLISLWIYSSGPQRGHAGVTGTASSSDNPPPLDLRLGSIDSRSYQVSPIFEGATPFKFSPTAVDFGSRRAVAYVINLGTLHHIFRLHVQEYHGCLAFFRKVVGWATRIIFQYSIYSTSTYTGRSSASAEHPKISPLILVPSGSALSLFDHDDISVLPSSKCPHLNS
ncbi:hypothetical protein R3P38DRAFT_3296714, partial [Favolaschia claudopus]